MFFSFYLHASTCFDTKKCFFFSHLDQDHLYYRETRRNCANCPRLIYSIALDWIFIESLITISPGVT